MIWQLKGLHSYDARTIEVYWAHFYARTKASGYGYGGCVATVIKVMLLCNFANFVI